MQIHFIWRQIVDYILIFKIKKQIILTIKKSGTFFYKLDYEYLKQLDIHHHDKKSIKIKGFRRGCFRVQRNLFSYLWNLKTQASIENQRGEQKIWAVWEPKACASQSVEIFFFSLEGEKCAELWDASSIYRGWNAEKISKKHMGENPKKEEIWIRVSWFFRSKPVSYFDHISLLKILMKLKHW